MVRLDTALAEQLRISRTKATALIMAGEVTVNGAPARKPGQDIPADALIKHDAADPYVSRAAGKLQAALDTWPIDVADKVALDIGSSTGGFTQLLLERGAQKLYAVDVGRGQLAWSLRHDPRVVGMEETDIRDVEVLPESPDIVTIDVSFTSLRTIWPAVRRLSEPGTPVIALFKPQFEVGKAIADQFRGVITNDVIIDETLSDFMEWIITGGDQINGQLVSPVKGTKGNRERLLWINRG